MSVQSCPEGMLLIANLGEAMRRQCELPAHPTSADEIALELDASEAVQDANRHATDHIMKCPICRTTNRARPSSSYPSSATERTA
jgi:hypothetical protein